MIVCSSCQFENPSSNKFCQNCGSPLKLLLAVVTLGADSVTLSTEAVDSSSAYQASTEPRELEGPEVLQSTERLPQSQLDDEMPILGQEALALVPELTSLLQPDSIGQAISSPLSLEDSFAIAATDSDTAAADMPVFVPVSSAKPLAIPPELTGQYLDDKQRYQLKQPLVPNTFSHLELEASVIDCRPADPPPLAELAEQLTKVVEQSANQTETLSSVLPDALPASALPYLLLQSNFFPAIPELHSAWQSDRYTVLVLEQRDHFGKLLDYWKTEETEALQQVHWCYEMSELWQALAPYQGQPSLLNIENLRIDEDQILCLQRLFFQSASTQYTLRDLGLLWQVLLQQVSNALSDLVELARDLGAGKLESVQALQSRLVEVADRLSQSVSSHEANLEPESNTSEMVSQSQPHSEQIDTPETPIAGELELLLEAEELLDLPEEEGLVNDSPTMVLPMILVELNEAGQTHVGQQREHNEDTFCIKSAANKLETPKERQLQAKGMYILCDGMGGHESGEVASALAVETLQSYFSECWQSSLPSEDEIKQAIAQANDVIYNTNQVDERSGNSRMGTTLVMVLLQETHAVVAHVGDSRLYRYSRRLGLQQVTCDHEVGQREIQRGVEPTIAYARPDAYQLTQALGPRDSSNIRPSINFLEFNEDTLLLLCSDGLSDNDLLNTHASSHVEPLLDKQADLDAGLERLIDLANEQNGHDNITAIAIRLGVKPNLVKIRKPD